MSGVAKRVAALKSFNVRSYLLGSSLSYIGTFTQSFAQWWLILTISGNRTALPITIGLQAAPLLLLGTWGGTIVDRSDNRRLLGVTLLNTVAAVGLGVSVAAGLPIAVWEFSVGVWLVVKGFNTSPLIAAAAPSPVRRRPGVVDHLRHRYMPPLSPNPRPGLRPPRHHHQSHS